MNLKIETQDDALKILGDTTRWLGILAILQMFYAFSGDEDALVQAFLYGWLGLGVFLRSRFAGAVGVAFYLLVIGVHLSQGFDKSVFFTALIFLLMTRATYALFVYHRIRDDKDSTYRRIARAVFVVANSTLLALVAILVVVGLATNLQDVLKNAVDGIPQEEKPLGAARAEFQTQLHDPQTPWPKHPAPFPPAGSGLEMTHYTSPVGELAAYISPDPKDGQKHPAVLWAKGGFGGIGSYLWEVQSAENDQSVRAFLDANLVVMTPSWRGENDNPGRFELFYGEVDDYLAALAHLRALPYVDPNRVYLAGHSTGGTLVLLAATASADFRAAFSFGGRADVLWLHDDGQGEGYGNTPYDIAAKREHELRSASRFTHFIEKPVYYFEGSQGAAVDAMLMASQAFRSKKPMWAISIEDADHFSILQPTERILVKALLRDDGKGSFKLSEDDLKSVLANTPGKAVVKKFRDELDVAEKKARSVLGTD